MNLIEHPDPRQKLVDDPSPEHMRVSVEEFIRWVSPVLDMKRTVTETHELHGQTLDAGLLTRQQVMREPHRLLPRLVPPKGGASKRLSPSSSSLK